MPQKERMRHFAPFPCHPQVRRVALQWLLIDPDRCVLAVNTAAATKLPAELGGSPPHHTPFPPCRALSAIGVLLSPTASRIRNARFLGVIGGGGRPCSAFQSRAVFPGHYQQVQKTSQTPLPTAQVSPHIHSQEGFQGKFQVVCKNGNTSFFLENLLCAGCLTHFYPILQHENRAGQISTPSENHTSSRGGHHGLWPLNPSPHTRCAPAWHCHSGLWKQRRTRALFCPSSLGVRATGLTRIPFPSLILLRPVPESTRHTPCFPVFVPDAHPGCKALPKYPSSLHSGRLLQEAHPDYPTENSNSPALPCLPFLSPSSFLPVRHLLAHGKTYLSYPVFMVCPPH